MPVQLHTGPGSGQDPQVLTLRWDGREGNGDAVAPGDYRVVARTVRPPPAAAPAGR